MIDKENINKIVYNSMEISWSLISEKLKIYSADDCRNTWNFILYLFNLEKKSDIKKDLKMLSK